MSTSETLKSGVAPALVANIEVFQMLSQRITVRDEKAAAAAAVVLAADADENDNADVNAKNNGHSTVGGRGRGGDGNHRDWIERKVFDYLSNSACGKVESEKMGQLVSVLRRDVVVPAGGAVKGEDKNKVEDGGDGDDAMEVDDKGDGNDGDGDGECDVKGEGDGNGKTVNKGGYGLTDAETLQVLNLMPVQSVDLHLLIEDLPSRMSEERQNELMELIGGYSGEPDAAGTAAEGDGEGGVAGDEEVVEEMGEEEVEQS